MAYTGDPFESAKKHRSGFMSFLDWLGNTQQMGLNAVRGDFGAVGRHAADFLSGPIRALIPGDQSDWEMSRPEDDTSLSEMTGVDRKEHPILATATDLAGLAFDPLTYVGLPEVSLARNAARAAKAGEALAQGAKAAETVGGGVRASIPFTGLGKTFFEGADLNPLSNIGKAIDKGASKLPDAAQAKYKGFKQGVKETFGYLNPTPEVADLTKRAEAMKSTVGKTASDHISEALKNVAPEALADATHLLNNVVPDEATGYRAIVHGPTESFTTREGQQALIDSRLNELPWEDGRKQAAADAARKLSDYYRTHWSQGAGELGVFDHPAEFGPETHAPTDYLPRSYGGKDEIADDAFRSDPNMLHRRTVGTGEDLAKYLNESKSSLDTDALKSALKYGGRMGTAAEKATVAKGLLGDAFDSLSNPKTRSAVSDTIDNLRQSDPDSYRALSTAYDGLKARGPLLQMIAGANGFFKKAAVAGIVLPKISTIMRNAIAFPTQQAVTEAAGGAGAAVRQVLRTPQTIWNGIREGVHTAFGISIPTDQLGQAFDLISQAYKQSGGRAKNVADFLRRAGPNGEALASAVENGVLGGGNLSTDGIYKAMTGTGWGQRALKAVGVPASQAKAIAGKAVDLAEAPSAIFQGTEQYARLANYLELLKAKKSPSDAAKAVAEAFYDYKVTGTKERTLRDLIPFAAFQTRALRQSAKAIAEHPAIGSAMNTVENQRDSGPVYPYLQDQLRIPIGKDQQGNSQYIAGLSLPIESLNTIPTSFRDVKRDVVGASAPVLKSLWGAVSGEDPYFETKYGSYDRAPIPLQPLLGEHSKAGAAYNELAGTGLIQFLDTPVRQLDKLLDPRHDAGTKAVDLLTGANVVSVDEDRAKKQLLEEALKRDPNARTYTGFMSHSDDPKTDALLAALRKAKARMKAKPSGP